MNLRRNRKRLKIKLGHASMLYKVSQAQAESDFEKIFRRGYDWVTGTEGGADSPVRDALFKIAEKWNYRVFEYKSNWVAVERSCIEPGTWTTMGHTVIDNDLVIGPGHDTNVVHVSFFHKLLGPVSIFVSHYPTKGRPDGKGIYRRNLKWTRKIARAISKMVRKFGKGRDIAFYGGDQNIVDRVNDTFFGGPLTSCWDEVGKYENTGHGNIDVIASYDSDKRVSCDFARAFDDKELHLFTDHYLVEAGYTVEY